MSPRERVLDLLERWQAALEQGRDLSADELCRDHPELLPHLEPRLADLRRLTRLAAEVGPTDGPSVGHSGPAVSTLHDAGPAAPEAETSRSSDSWERGDRVPLPTPSPTVPGYEVLGELGRGGMGVVYKARQLRLNRVVALKMVLEGGLGSQAARARFLTEAEAIARLQHPHIVQVFQAGEHEGQPFFVMEYVAGGSLERVGAAGPHDAADAARLVMLLARAVDAAHRAGVIHRDLKPANVLLAPPADEPALNTPWGCPKVSDFGLARLQDRPKADSVNGCLMGSPRYMAPEQAAGRMSDIGPATDVWALGVILYQLLTGRPPFDGESLTAILDRVRATEPPPVRSLRPEIPDALERIVRCCLRKDFRSRYPTAAALADDLRRWLDGATPTLPVVGRPRSSRRRWLAAVAAGVVLLAGLGGVGAWLLNRPPADPGGPPVAEPFKGWIDVLVSEPGNKKRQLLRLHEPEARPLRPGDEVRVEVVLKGRPGYAYVLWIDARGKVFPVHPWRGFDWGRRSAKESPVTGRLLLPEEGGVYPIEPSPEGLETLVLLVRETPLPADADLPGLLGDLGEQTGTDQDYVRWFENGQVVTDEAGRAPSGRAEASDPAERTQGRIRRRLGELFAFSRAVSFFNAGRR